MHGPATAPAAPPATTCACGAPGELRVVDPDGAHDICALHAIELIGGGGTRVTLVLDAGAR